MSLPRDTSSTFSLNTPPNITRTATMRINYADCQDLQMRLTCESDTDYDPFSVYSVHAPAITNTQNNTQNHEESLTNNAFVCDVDDMGFHVSRHVGVPFMSAEQIEILEKKRRIEETNKKNIERYNICIGKAVPEESEPAENNSPNETQFDEDHDKAGGDETQPVVQDTQDEPGTMVNIFLKRKKYF
jgi:hypothetical protein